MECHWRGTLLLKVGLKFLVLKNSLFIPGSATLVAISYLTNKLKYTISLDKNGMYLFKDNESYRSGSPTFTLSKKITDTLWRFPLQVFEKDDSKRNKAFVASMSDDLDPEIIHARYIHCSLPYLQKIYPQLRNCRELPPCDPCHAMVPRKRYKSMYSTKSEQLSTHLAGFVGNNPDESTRLHSQPAEMEEKTGSFFFNDLRNDPPEPGDSTPFPEFATGVFSDKFMHDPPEPDGGVESGMSSRHDNFSREYGRYFSSDTKTATCQSIRGYNYLFVVVDHDTRVVETFLGVNKSDFHAEVSFFLKNFYNVHKRFPAYWKFDSGGENENHAIIEMFKEMGVDHKFTTTAAHNQNAHVERVIGVIWNYVRRILIHAGMPLVFWCYASKYVTFVMNHIPHRSLKMRSPFDFAGMMTYHEMIRTFGCEVWYTSEPSSGKNARKRRGVFLGVSGDRLGYLILDIETGKVVVSRNVTFNEREFPFLQEKKSTKIELDIGTWPKAVPNYKITANGPVKERGGFDEFLSNPEIFPSNSLDVPSETFPETFPRLSVPPENPTDNHAEQKPSPERAKDLMDEDFMVDGPSHSPDFPPTDPVLDGEALDQESHQSPELPSSSTISSTPTQQIPLPVADLSPTIISPIDLNTTRTPITRDFPSPDLSNTKETNTTKSWPKGPEYLRRKLKEDFGPRVRNKAQPPPQEIDHSEPQKFFLKLDGQNSSLQETKMDAWENEKFVVEEILRERKTKGGGNLYEIKWEGYEDTTWEPIGSLKECKELLNNFKARKRLEAIEEGTTKPPKTIPPKTLPTRRSARLNKIPDTIFEDQVANSTALSFNPSITTFQNHSQDTDTIFHDLDETLTPPPIGLGSIPVYVSTEPYDEDTPIYDGQQFDCEFSRDVRHLSDYAYSLRLGGGPPGTTSEEFNPPPSFEEHHHFVPANISLEEAINLSYVPIQQLLDGYDHEKLAPPKTRNSMMQDEFKDEYIKAEFREIAGIRKHGTYEEVFIPKGRKPITCRWVYDLKRDSEGTIVLFKARLVVHGFKQMEGIDFQKTFSSTIQMRTFRMLVAISVQLGMKLTQYDISNAFLNGTLKEEVYMDFPPGYSKGKEGKCWKLLKGLYGLKQASRLWQETLYAALKELGLSVCKTESGVLHYRCPKTGDLVLVACWVDDLIVSTKNERLRKLIENKLEEHFISKTLGPLSLYVGVVVDIDDVGNAELHQGPYNGRMIKKYLQPGYRPSSIPARSTERLSKIDSPATYEERKKIDYPYINATGSILYSAICTRPDIFYATMQLAKFNSNPGEKHVEASKMLLRYIGGTQEEGIKFRKDPDFDGKLRIKAYVDSDWGGDPDTRRSTVGFIVHINGGPVSWKSKTLKTIALSSCEAEFMALSEVCRELMWMCRFLDEVGIEYHTPEIYCDSSSALNWSEDPIQHQRNKHVEIKYYFVRDMIADKLVRAFKIHTTKNISDMMTKPVGKLILGNLKPGAMGWVNVDHSNPEP